MSENIDVWKDIKKIDNSLKTHNVTFSWSWGHCSCIELHTEWLYQQEKYAWPNLNLSKYKYW